MPDTYYCMTVGVLDHETQSLKERLHMHVDTSTEDVAIAVTLHQCISNNVSVKDCVIVVTRVVPIPAETVDYMEKARLMNHGHDAPLTPGATEHLR